ncbi:MAG: hypothetical protein IT367_14945 [Candidatus Hydrogenedentes bacterium]|nr:hypothetical protein [Candidatus Hydrogenedentota bacterium]
MMHAVVQTMICADCTVLVDVLIGASGEIGLTGDAEYDKDIGLCPECHGRNLSNWSDIHPCPKCGAEMETGDPEVLWD